MFLTNPKGIQIEVPMLYLFIENDVAQLRYLYVFFAVFFLLPLSWKYDVFDAVLELNENKYYYSELTYNMTWNEGDRAFFKSWSANVKRENWGNSKRGVQVKIYRHFVFLRAKFV